MSIGFMGPAGLWPLRALITLFGIASFLWAIESLPGFLREAPLIAASERLVAGEAYNEAAIADLKLRADEADAGGASPRARGAISVLRQWQLERNLARREASPAEIEKTKKAITDALSVAPSDSYQWLSLYWASRADGSYEPHYLEYLTLSYETGPYEAWIALRRSPLALAVFPLLTPPLQKAALEEFAGLVRSHLYGQAAAIAASVTPNTRKAIASKLELLSLADRESFFKASMEQGITDIIIPGVQIGPVRPWRQ